MNDIFSIKKFSFPKNFIWGSATAGHQIEGNNVNADLYFHEQNALKLDPGRDVSGMACNHYNMVEGDVMLIKELGHQAYRMSLEWSRIEPREGEFNKEALEHYLNELRLLRESGIKVFLTLVHFTVPLWFDERGSFMKLDNYKYFEKYLKYIVPKISEYVDYWNIFNEFNISMIEKAMNRKYYSLIYHGRAYHLIKQYSSAPVSTAHAFVQYFGRRQNDIFDKTMQNYYDICMNEFFFHAIRTGEIVLPYKDAIVDNDVKNTCDFWAINLYTREMIDTRKANFKGERFAYSKSQMIPKDFYLDEIYPECMFQNLTRLMDKPVFITENGCACNNDDFRIVYMTEYLSALHDAIQAGVDVRGFLYWSLLDNYEWGSYTPRFGLVNVDRANNFKRTIKPSGYFYKDIIQNNGFDPETLRRYLKKLPRLDVK